MPLISVLTPVHAERAEFLAEAGESLAAQDLPAGWELEWLIQEDGSASTPAVVAQRFPFSRYQANGESLGVNIARNVALARASGSLVHVLDSDDLLLPNALRTAIEAFDAHPRIHWVTGQAHDLLPDSSRLSFPAPLEPGLIEPGVLTQLILDSGRPAAPCAGLTARTGTVRAFGGWVATPRGGDLALLVALAETTPGFLPPDVTWLYRRHSGQITGQAGWSRLQDESMAVIHQRIAALRGLGVRVLSEPAPCI
ncbi:glycosyltransferase family 2 protein [Actinoplanes regularis]|uniref:glycosyltransferase family 2 protein n=1 Tax=Actinoplanes regularis TaxID=52697 RepID=UPI00255318D9|nr:glycosyltransferase family A protein [Actinoplanes regularis]GLW27899.1 glycosyl transferase [Actinoplanes regularis]